MKRVVVTGLGVLSPLGRGVEHNFEQLLDGKSGIKKIEGIDLKDIPVQIAGVVPWGDGEFEFNPDSVVEPKDQKKLDKFIMYGMAAGLDAIKDSGWEPKTDEDAFRSGVMMGSGIGGLDKIYQSALAFEEGGMKKISPCCIPSGLINLITGNLAISCRMKGPNHAC